MRIVLQGCGLGLKRRKSIVGCRCDFDRCCFRSVFHAQADNHHENDQNADHIGDDVEKRVAAERFGGVDGGRSATWSLRGVEGCGGNGR